VQGLRETPAKKTKPQTSKGMGTPSQRHKPAPAIAYGLDRLYSEVGIIRSWYTTDALGSVRAISSNAGIASAIANYDPYGGLQGSAIGSFGFTGELQQGSNVYLRARWYNATNSTFTSRDPFTGYAQAPYSQHYYAYGYSNPVLLTDPSGRDPWWNGDVDARPCPAGQFRDEAGRCVYYKEWPDAAARADIASGGASVRAPELSQPLIFTNPTPPKRSPDYPAPFPRTGNRIFTPGITGSGLLVFDPPPQERGLEGFDNCRIYDGLYPEYLTNSSGGFDSDNIFLYHGSPTGIAGGKFAIEEVAPNRRPNHFTSEDPAIFFTDDVKRAATQYATPSGVVARVEIPRRVADAAKQFDRYGNTEYKFTTTAQVELLNANIEILPQREAILRWWRR
jgi:RHS repeat-associated protein